MFLTRRRRFYYRSVMKHADRCIPGLSKLYERYAKRALGFEYGRNRAVFIMGKYVVKIPRCWDGVADNDWEGSVRHSPHPEEAKYVRTRMVYVDEIPIVFAEYVKPASIKDMKSILGTVPSWTDAIDCQQVGFNREGRLLAYDYGIR